jgi:uncharacterized protein YvpB
MLDSSAQPNLEPAAHPLFLGSLALVGLVAIGISIWFVYMQGHLTALPPPSLPALGVNARATRAALQAEIETYQAANETLRTENVALRTELERTQIELAQAQSHLQTLSDQQGSTVLDQPPLALILDVPQLAQERSLSCESSAAAMAAQYHRLPVSESDILHSVPLHENPHLGFRGNVDGAHGGLIDYGVYAAPIQRVLSELGLHVEPFVGGIGEIKEHIRQGRPVLAWITYNLDVQIPQQWMLVGADGQQQAVTLVPYEHTILIVGYNREGLWVHDPFDGTRTFYPEGEFWRSFGYLGQMALVIGPPAD